MRKFNEVMEAIKQLFESAYNELCRDDPRKWTLAHDGGYRWGVTTTNDSESFNNVLKGARDLPIIACVQVTFYHLVNTFSKKQI